MPLNKETKPNQIKRNNSVGNFKIKFDGFRTNDKKKNLGIIG